MAMNVNLFPTVTGTANSAGGSGASQGSGSGKATNASGFAGALVEAIGGEPAIESGTQAMPISAALLFGTLTEAADSSDPSGEKAEGEVDASALLSLLGELIAKLQASLQGDQAESDSEQHQENADLLAAIQAFLVQLQPAATVDPDASGIPLNGQAGEAEIAALPDDVLSALLVRAEQLSKQLDGKNVTPGTAAQFADQVMKAAAMLSQADAAKNAVVAGPAQDVLLDVSGTPETAQEQPGKTAPSLSDANSAKAASVADGIKSAVESPETALQRQPVAEAANPPETGRKVAAFREPFVMWNWAAEADAELPDSNAAIVSGATEAGQADNEANSFALPLFNGASGAVKEAAVQPSVPTQVPVQQFAREIGGFLVKQFVLLNGNGMTEAKISLHPEHLGHVDVRIVMQDGQMTAQFVAQNESAKELIENQLGLLRTSLLNQDIRVERIEVTVQHAELQDPAAYQEQERRESNSGRDSGGSAGTGGDASLEDVGEFEEELNRSSGLREAGYGSSLNVTA